LTGALAQIENTHQVTMAEHQFTLRFDVSAVPITTDEALERLATAGCDDAIVGTGVPGRLAMTFDREGDSAAVAVGSAIRDVTRALPDVRLVEASPDVVGLSDLGAIVGRTRQNMRKLLLPTDGSAPAPLHEGNPSLWHLAVVLEWLRSTKTYVVSDDLLDLARATMQINLAIQRRLIDTSMSRDIERLVG
jgi:hypothetical protein